MNLFDFTTKFPNEETCRTYLKEQREKDGITCKKCGSTNHFWLVKVEKWQCRDCKSRTNLRSGTIMTKSNLPVRKWFMAIHLMTTAKKSFSALEMQRQLGFKFYEPVWYMMGKIRRAMGKRDSKYKLNGSIEIDDAFFEIVDLPLKDELGNIISEEQKRGRGSKRQMKVLVMVESTPTAQSNPHKKNRKMGYAKMVVMDDLTTTGIGYEVGKAVEPNTTISSDGYPSYMDLANKGYNHDRMIVKPEEGHKKLPWVHTVISNAKRQFLGVRHSIGKDYLQNYLNEFTYKLNRRNFTSDLFDRMITAGINDTWY